MKFTISYEQYCLYVYIILDYVNGWRLEDEFKEDQGVKAVLQKMYNAGRLFDDPEIFDQLSEYEETLDMELTTYEIFSPESDPGAPGDG